MLTRLARAKRVRAGWFVALLYLVCVLSPGVALALGDAASCLALAVPSAIAAQADEDAPPHHAAGASHRHHGAHAGNHADSGKVVPEHAKHQHDGKASPGPCCAMLCVSAIAADLPVIAKPSQPVSACVSDSYQRPPGEAPPFHYRPPIA